MNYYNLDQTQARHVASLKSVDSALSATLTLIINYGLSLLTTYGQNP